MSEKTFKNKINKKYKEAEENVKVKQISKIEEIHIKKET